MTQQYIRSEEDEKKFKNRSIEEVEEKDQDPEFMRY